MENCDHNHNTIHFKSSVYKLINDITMAEFILLLIVGLAVLLLILLVLREFFCWYFKINQLIKLEQLKTETQLKIYEQNGGKVDWEKANKSIHAS